MSNTNMVGTGMFSFQERSPAVRHSSARKEGNESVAPMAVQLLFQRREEARRSPISSTNIRGNSNVICETGWSNSLTETLALANEEIEVAHVDGFVGSTILEK
jgi:hypothetical protein